MQLEAKGRFFKLLGDVMAGYGKALDPATMEVWFNMLVPFDPATIRAAFDTYAAERPDFAPAPNGIVARCKLLDGRPTDDEAWAISLTSRDERETVVWTTEMGEAFRLCAPVLNGGDEVGARMAFKDAYNRLVAAARLANKPAVWSVSEGWDLDRRKLEVKRAVRAGLLPAPPEHLMLTTNSETPAERPEGLKRVLEAVAQLENPLEKLERLRLERVQAEYEAERARTLEIANQVQQYKSKGGQHD